MLILKALYNISYMAIIIKDLPTLRNIT
uniref:Uncharacterized protein n=1 Tax=Arundo donax TaxID=35708 RepID=A0A0A8XRW6_ARUDO